MRFGAKILQGMGWKEGTGLGAKRDGIVEPVTVKRRQESLGIGAERRPFQDSWWEKLMEDAYGKPSDGGGRLDLFDACEGRRCRPHGKSKLARLERHDTTKSVVNKSETPQAGNGEKSAESSAQSEETAADNARKQKRTKKKRAKSSNNENVAEAAKTLADGKGGSVKRRKRNRSGKESSANLSTDEKQDAPKDCLSDQTGNSTTLSTDKEGAPESMGEVHEIEGSKKFMRLAEDHGATVDDTFRKRLVKLDKLVAKVRKADEEGGRGQDGELLTDEEKKQWREAMQGKLRSTEKKLMKTINKSKSRHNK